MTSEHQQQVEVPALPKRLSQALEEIGAGRDSWPSRLREELGLYVVQLRDSGMTPERSLAIVKQLARPLFEHSERLKTQAVSWILEAYYDRRGSDRPGR